VRRLVLLSAVAVLAFAGVAYAVANTLTYTGTGSHKGTPSVKKPANYTYTGTLNIDTEPPGQQPDIAPTTRVFFAKQIKNNAALFPSCKQAEIDGMATIPAKCTKAIVGKGAATAYAGQPGAPRANSVKEDLTVKAINGPKGKKLFLVVSSTPTAPVQILNRVIPGTVVRASGPFGFSVRFDIPENLQTQLGLSISLTYFQVKISGTPRTFTVKGKKVKVSYLQVTSCPGGKLPVKAIAKFKDSANGGTLTPVTSASRGKC